MADAGTRRRQYRQRPARRRRCGGRFDHLDGAGPRKTPRVAGTQRAAEHAGRDDEMAYQEMLKGLELKRDMESILVGTNQAKTAGNDSTARTTASALAWIKTNTS